jgi:hypothetical protein
MSELCEHETFKDICGTCHRDVQITHLTAENEMLRADIAYADKHASKVESLLWGTAKENEKLRAALEFYANPENWVSVWDHQFKMMAQEPVYRDEGNKARAALSGEKQ